MLDQLSPQLTELRDLVVVVSMLGGGVAAFVRILRVDRAWRDYAETIGRQNAVLMARVAELEISNDGLEDLIRKANDRARIAEERALVAEGQVVALRAELGALERDVTTLAEDRKEEP